MNVRPAEEIDLEHLTIVWHDGWRDAHAEIVPPVLARLRTMDSFRDRLRAALPNVRVVGPLGAPFGFCIVREDELYQLFVAAQSRGSGAAAALIDDAEAQFSKRGIKTAWLACAIGNDRAARFYEKRGWIRTGVMVNVAETPNGPFPLETWRYEKRFDA